LAVTQTTPEVAGPQIHGASALHGVPVYLPPWVSTNCTA